MSQTYRILPRQPPELLSTFCHLNSGGTEQLQWLRSRHGRMPPPRALSPNLQQILSCEEAFLKRSCTTYCIGHRLQIVIACPSSCPLLNHFHVVRHATDLRVVTSEHRCWFGPHGRQSKALLPHEIACEHRKIALIRKKVKRRKRHGCRSSVFRNGCRVSDRLATLD